MNADIDSIVDLPHNVDPHDDDTEEKTNKFYEVKSYYENMNYWDDNEEDIWYDTLSSGGPTTDINDHLDTKVNKPTKDIDNQVDKEEPHEDNDIDIWYDSKSKQRPFHLTIDHQTIGHR